MAPTITPYNLVNMSTGDSNAMSNFIANVSASTNYLPGLIILLIIFSIIFFSLLIKGTSLLKSFSSALFVNLILAILLFPAHIINAQILTVSIVLVPISILLLFMLEGGY